MLRLQAASLAALVLAIAPAWAQTNPNAKVTGHIVGPLSPGVHEDVEFTCYGSPTCVGQYNEDFRTTDCSNVLSLGGTITITGVQLGQSGSIQGNITMSHWDWEIIRQGDGTCRIGGTGPSTFPYTGNYNAGTRTGTMNMNVHGFTVPGTFSADTNSTPPIFPMQVRSQIDAVSATASADIQYRPQDVGTQGSVFVFAMAPASRVIGVSESTLKLGWAKDERKADTPIGCVLAQLNAAGQLVGVSSANLAAYLTGVLSAQGASVSILNGVPTSNVSGATFFVGYGANSSSMINSGINRAAVTVPGSLVCAPSAPQTGWWWNPAEDGRGYSIEMRGNNLFFAAFLYDVSGRSTWHVSSGPVSLEGTLYNGDLLSASGGQTLGGPYSRFPTLANAGRLNLTFNNHLTGTMVWPGGTVPLQRFNIVPNGLGMQPVGGQPESGWWWNENEPGRGFFLEFQGGWLDIAGYMYDDNGNPVWYLTVGQLGGSPAARNFTGTWWSYGNGMTLGGPWRPHSRINDNVAPVTITFSGADSAFMTLPNGRTTSLRRHRF